MLLDDLNQVPIAPERAVVINVNTEAVSAVAIASALRHAGMPLLVVNCTKRGPARDMMTALASEWNFDLIDLQLAPHGVTLDRLFQQLYADRILLLDSDAELLSPLSTPRMSAAFADPSVYGSGWLHSFDVLTPTQSGVEMPVVYHERPWIPCAMFRTSYVRAALNAGVSFNENWLVGGAARAIPVPSDIAMQGPTQIIHNDTGAELHAWATHAGMKFSGPPVTQATEEEVAHYHGVTRSVMVPGMNNATHLSEVENDALQRLQSVYPERWDGFVNAVNLASA